jgi:DNA repair protein RecO (recombination protein O)
MRWSDEGIVLSARRHGERGLIVHLLTRERGRHAGLVRGGQGPRTRMRYQTGNRLAVSWSARLSEHLGYLAGELLRGHAARFIDDRVRLACLSSAAAMAEVTLPEREPHPRAYAGLNALLEALDDDGDFAALYVRWELDLLAELGYGLDLSHCVATGARESLTYVSPRSGQAVSENAASPYREKLLRLPRFLLEDGNNPAPSDILDGLALTGYFLDRRVLAPHERKIPAARARFADVIQRSTAEAQSRASALCEAKK